MATDSPQFAPSPAEVEALQYGIDISLIEHNLTLSYEERVQQHESALALVRELGLARESLYSKP